MRSQCILEILIWLINSTSIKIDTKLHIPDHGCSRLMLYMQNTRHY